MILYCLLAVPLFALFIVSYKLQPGSDSRRLWVQYSRGILTFIPAYIVYLLIAGLVPLTYSYGGIFAYYLVYNALYYALFGALAYVLIRIVTREESSVSEVFVFLAGFFTFASVLEIVREFPYFDAYALFLYPTIRLAIIAALGFLLARAFESTGWERWLYFGIGLAFVTVTALVPFFFVIHIAVAAIVITLVLFVGSLFPYVVMAL